MNTLTVIASESYESFVKGLQSEIAEDVFGKQSRKADVCRDIEVIIPENARSRRVELKSRSGKAKWRRIQRIVVKYLPEIDIYRKF